VSDPGSVEVVGPRRVLDFGPLDLPKGHWVFHAPAWATAPLRKLARVRPRLDPAACIGCGQCAEVCPRDVIAPGKPPTFDLDNCIGCLCCAEICPQGAIQPQRSLLARLIGIGY
jgi:MinD superfamily P-loop ATPase